MSFSSLITISNRFAHCRPLLDLDDIHLKHKYLDILLAATAVDVNGSLFPFVYAIIDAENDDNWLWFLHHIREIIECYVSLFLQSGELVFLSNRQKRLLDNVDQVFLDSYHDYCLRYFQDNFHHEFKNVELKELLW